MAVKAWNSKTNTVVFDENIYNTNSNTWVNQQTPSAQRSYAAFKSKLSLNVDKNSGFVTLSIKHQSPFVAKQWASLVIDEVNSYYRLKDKLESERAVSYLNKQIAMTSLSEIKQVLAQLLQEETKKLTLIEANQFYVFDYIDPPVVMEQKSEPRRALICILSFLLGVMLSILLVLIKHYASNKKTS
jgi:LPS O-antigen subunit length determinant protein (WzzB/FepE family)